MLLLAPAFAAIVVSISASADVSPSLVGHVVDETNAIWKPAGVTFVWQRDGQQPSTEVAVAIGHDRGSAQSHIAPIGWIVFDGGRPERRMYLSIENAVALLDGTRGPREPASEMPLLERETYLGRALGRALAHELGHYLLADKTHTTTGLMKANFSAAEFFTPDRSRFTLTAAQQAIVAARVDQTPLIAATGSGSSSPTSQPPASPRRGVARWSGPTPRL